MTSDYNNKLQFASDNYSPACDSVLKKITAVSTGFAVSYGEDNWCHEARQQIQQFFETDCEVYFVFNGTAANALSLSTICQPYHGIITHPTSHIQVDESGAPEFFIHGSKIFCYGDNLKKFKAEDISKICHESHGVHSSKPNCFSFSQSTEVGLVYTPEEIKTLCQEAHSHGWKVHMDGARFFNAIAQQKVTPRELSWQGGVDVMSFGGTKNGSTMAEAIVFFNKELANEFGWRQKQTGQLYSKSRYQAAAWLGLLENEVWLQNAKNANAQAAYLAKGLRTIEGIELLYPVETNILFASMPEKTAKALLDDGWRFYDFPKIGAWRFVCSWCTKAEDVDRFLQDIRKNV